MQVYGESPNSLTLVRSLCGQVYGTEAQVVFVQSQAAHLFIGLPVVGGYSCMAAEAGSQPLCDVGPTDMIAMAVNLCATYDLQT